MHVVTRWDWMLRTVSFSSRINNSYTFLCVCLIGHRWCRPDWSQGWLTKGAGSKVLFWVQRPQRGTYRPSSLLVGWGIYRLPSMSAQSCHWVTFTFIFILSSSARRYSPGWSLASLTISLHWSLPVRGWSFADENFSTLYVKIQFVQYVTENISIWKTNHLELCRETVDVYCRNLWYAVCLKCWAVSVKLSDTYTNH